MGKYTNNKTVRILIAILKGHGIRKIVVSPGTTNFMFVASIQNDDWFEIKSAADERSAAYIACGWAAETQEPIVVSCTGATASRNYLPALTEAFYRNLPVLAITSINDSSLPGNNTPQVIDRSQLPKDVVKISVNISEVHDNASEKKCIILANKAILGLSQDGGGPVHINLTTKMTGELNFDTLPKPRIIKRYTRLNELPEIAPYKRIAVYIGSHSKFDEGESKNIEKFCDKYGAIVLCDHTSNYKGRNCILSAFVAAQEQLNRNRYKFDLVIDLGGISGNYYQFDVENVWRVSEDGELRDRFGKLKAIFQMTEQEFFELYNQCSSLEHGHEFKNELIKLDDVLRKQIPELPFSNIWMAQQLSKSMPDKCVIHFGILNSLRAWNFFDIPHNVYAYSNVGGFGIDGGISTLIGASFADLDKMYFGVVGDLAFFYDMNSIGNRHVGKNVRILVVNNGKGTEFRNYSHPASKLGDRADDYIAAAGHYGDKSSLLLKHYAEDLGFEYLCASNKDEFIKNIKRFLDCTNLDRPIIFEAFTDSGNESDALHLIRNVIPEPKSKALIKSVLGDNSIKKIKQVIGRK